MFLFYSGWTFWPPLLLARVLALFVLHHILSSIDLGLVNHSRDSCGHRGGTVRLAENCIHCAGTPPRCPRERPVMGKTSKRVRETTRVPCPTSLLAVFGSLKKEKKKISNLKKNLKISYHSHKVFGTIHGRLTPERSRARGHHRNVSTDQAHRGGNQHTQNCLLTCPSLTVFSRMVCPDSSDADQSQQQWAQQPEGTGVGVLGFGDPGRGQYLWTVSVCQQAVQLVEFWPDLSVSLSRERVGVDEYVRIHRKDFKSTCM